MKKAAVLLHDYGRTDIYSTYLGRTVCKTNLRPSAVQHAKTTMHSPPLPKAGNSAYHDANSVYTHIADPNERRRLALAEVDKAPFGWYHVRLAVVTGIGFFTDAYSLFAINLAVIMLGIVYWQDDVNKGVMPHNADTAIKVATSAGAIFGQVIFGYLADVLGRKKMYGVELMIIISTTLAQSLCGESTAVSIVGVLIFYRVVMGIGVGGDYPLSAVITAEFASTKNRGGIIAAVFAMQGLGQLASALMALIVVAAYKSELETVPDVASCSGDCVSAVDKMWRIIIAFGGVPGWFALYYRLTIPETPRYTFDVLYDVEKASMDTRRYRYGKAGNTVNPIEQAQVRRDMAKYKTPRPTVVEIFRYYSKKSNFIKLFGTAFSWFFLDLAFYGLSFSSASLLSTMGFDKRGSLYENLKNTATGQIVLICAGAIPGYWMTVFTVDRLGRKPIQIGGFAILTIIFCVLGFAWKGLTKIHLLVLYVLAQFFFNFGPNATTFITPAEIFPTRVRSTGHGISAGLGKLGAVIAQVFFAPMIKRGATHDNPTPWIHGVMQIFALFMFLGCLTSLLVPESKSARLEDLAGEGEDIYELQFRSQFYTGGERSPLGSAPSGRGSAVSGGGEYARGRGRGRGAELDEDPEKGKWWKLG